MTDDDLTWWRFLGWLETSWNHQPVWIPTHVQSQSRPKISASVPYQFILCFAVAKLPRLRRWLFGCSCCNAGKLSWSQREPHGCGAFGQSGRSACTIAQAAQKEGKAKTGHGRLKFKDSGPKYRVYFQLARFFGSSLSGKMTSGRWIRGRHVVGSPVSCEVGELHPMALHMKYHDVPQL